MTQIILVQFSPAIRVPGGVALLPISSDHGHAFDAAPALFDDVTGVRRVVGGSGAAEPLVDALWEAQIAGLELERTRLGRLFAELVSHALPFACWQGDDFSKLPTVRSWDDVLGELRRQTVVQGDLFLRYPGPA